MSSEAPTERSPSSWAPLSAWPAVRGTKRRATGQTSANTRKSPLRATAGRPGPGEGRSTERSVGMVSRSRTARPLLPPDSAGEGDPSRHTRGAPGARGARWASEISNPSSAPRRLAQRGSGRGYRTHSTANLRPGIRRMAAIPVWVATVAPHAPAGWAVIRLPVSQDGRGAARERKTCPNVRLRRTAKPARPGSS